MSLVICGFPIQIEGKDPVTLLPSPSSLARNETRPLNPTNIYRLSVDHDDMPACAENEIRCSTSYKFQWLWEDQCTVNFACSKLQGNICGEFGVAVLTGSSETRVCQEKTVVQTNLSFYSALEIEIWTLQKADFAINCQFWCDRDESNSDITRPDNSSTVTDEDVQSLVDL